MDVKNRPGLCLRTGKTVQRNIETLCTVHYRFKKGFYGLSDIPTVFQEHIDKVLEFETSVWLDDIIRVTNGTAEDREVELRETLSN